MSADATCASAYAWPPEARPPEYVKSKRPPLWCLTVSPAPLILTSGRRSDFAISGRATINAPPPSVMTQQSRRCRGSATIGEASTSLTVSTSRSSAFGLCCAWWEAATLIQASCSLVVPYSYMWRMAHMAYPLTFAMPEGYSHWKSGWEGLRTRGVVPVATPSLRGRPASVIRATLHLPVAIACAAWLTRVMYEAPPMSVESTCRGRRFRYSTMEVGPMPGASPEQK